MVKIWLQKVRGGVGIKEEGGGITDFFLISVMTASLTRIYLLRNTINRILMGREGGELYIQIRLLVDWYIYKT